ncbi:MAG: BatA domain-containing protein [Pirellulaceae bacterium]|nr:BatA domain-containing protein [Pirellulaceae bacterium]
MSFLAWIFALGALTVVLPIVFHLVRPTPKGSQPFGSLIFLRQSPPRITKRNRIDNWLLLLLRSLVILLLVAAFMRPFIRTGGEIFVNDLPGNRVAILIDTSSSMRRDGVWEEVREALDKTLADLEPGDDVALFTFDRQLQTRVGFSESDVVDLASRKRMVNDQFTLLKPTWFQTDMGNALASTADFVSELDESRRSETGLQIVLISDMQQGADLGGLQTYVWPEDIRVQLCKVSPSSSSNAFARVLPDQSTTALDAGRRVRVTNAEDSDSETFEVAWQNVNGNIDEASKTTFYVPPGTSQLLRVPDPLTGTAEALVMTGDQSDFDNRYFVSLPSTQEIPIAYFGSDSKDDASGIAFFLDRVIPNSKSRIVRVDQYSPMETQPWMNGITPRLAVVSEAISASVAEKLEQWVQDGGLLLTILADGEVLNSMPSLMPTLSKGESEIPRDEYLMFGEIDFTHPLFQPLSGPRFNDFTNIRFWNRMELMLDDSDQDTQVVARFDDDSMAIWQTPRGDGLVIGMASSWRPADSQLAMSTKFVPLITSLLGMTDRTKKMSASYIVGDLMQVPDDEQGWQVEDPQGRKLALEAQQKNLPVFEQPGIYQFKNGDRDFLAAVNLNPAESQTFAVDSDRLESFDVRVGQQPSREELVGSLQKLKDRQLEQRQQIWKWLLLAVMGLLVVETLVAGKNAQQPITNEAAA